MRIHLIKSKEFGKDVFSEVIDILTSIPGPFQFVYEPDSVIDFTIDETFLKHVPNRAQFEKIDQTRPRRPAQYLRVFPLNLETATWETLFSKCHQYRTKNALPEDDFVILLTDLSNPDNWFSALDSGNPNNGYVHTAHWDHYIHCPPSFPIAYHVASLPIQRFIHTATGQSNPRIHQDPIGCVNDYCIQKREVILKLRTADICGECLDLLRPVLNPPYIHHVLKIIDTLRLRMLFAQNFRQESALSRLLVTKSMDLILTDFGNIHVRLRPLEKILYLLFLRHPDGLHMADLPDFRSEMQQDYSRIMNKGTSDDLRKRIEDLTSPLSNSASEKISRIKRSFEETIGRELSAHYIIKGDVGDKKKISLNRMLVQGL
jgi:hypothetical protein